MAKDEWSSILEELAAPGLDKLFPKQADVSKPPRLDPRPPSGLRRGDELSQHEPNPTGPVETFIGQKNDVTDPKAMEGLANTKAALGFVAGASGGALAGKAVSMLPGVSSLLAARSVAPVAVGGALEGAAAGTGATAASTVATEGRLPTGRELAMGGAMGAGAGAFARGVGASFRGAPQRETTAILRDAKNTGMTTPEYGRFFGSRDSAIEVLKADKALRHAIGNPEEVLSVLAERQPAANAAATRVMDAIDATNGRISTVDTNKAIGSVFHALEASGGPAASNPAAAAAYKLLEQYSGGIGKDANHPPSTKELRRFLTEEVGAKLNMNPNVEDSATDRAARLVYGKLKDLIGAHAENAGPKFASEVETLNKQQSTYSMLEAAATRKLAATSTGEPSKTQSLFNPVQATARAVGGALAGRTAAHFASIDPAIGEAAGAVAGAAGPLLKAGAKAAGEAATRAMATPGGQVVGATMEPLAAHSARVLVPKVIAAMRPARTGTPEDKAAALELAKKITADATYGHQ